MRSTRNLHVHPFFPIDIPSLAHNLRETKDNPDQHNDGFDSETDQEEAEIVYEVSKSVEAAANEVIAVVLN